MGLCWQMPKFIVWRLWSIYFDHHLPLKPSIGKRRKQSCTPNISLRVQSYSTPFPVWTFYILNPYPSRYHEYSIPYLLNKWKFLILMMVKRNRHCAVGRRQRLKFADGIIYLSPKIQSRTFITEGSSPTAKGP